jgi:hypothetical protein
MKRALLTLLVLGVVIGDTLAWNSASATFYGNHDYNGDMDSVSDGTCSCKKTQMYGICYNNWCFESITDPNMVAAINTQGSSNTRMCGLCAKIRCITGKYRGMSGSEFGADNICYDSNKEITVQITDSCPEIHRNPTNHKYCNMSFRHFDLSFWAFGHLAPHKFGVIDIQYEFVSCPVDLLSSFGVVAKKCCGGYQTCEVEL